MLETFWYETERRLRGMLVFVVVVCIYAAFAVGLFPSVEAAGANFQKLIQSYPEPLRQAFGIEAMGTIEGFLAGELYNFVWVLLLGVYFAYRAGGMIASDVERDRMDLLLSFPVSRSRIVGEKFASLIVPIVLLNVVGAIVIYLGTLAIGKSIDVVNLVMVHGLSIPFLLASAAIGLVISVVIDRADVAQRAALGIMFVLYLMESLAASTEKYEALQYLSPTYYYAPTEILVRGEYNLIHAGVLIVVFIVLLIGAQVLFERRDI